MKRISYPMTFLAVVLVLATMYVAGLSDDTLALEQQQYCHMVHEFQLSGGEVGWPDFEGTFAAECNADGSVKEAK